MLKWVQVKCYQILNLCFCMNSIEQWTAEPTNLDITSYFEWFFNIVQKNLLILGGTYAAPTLAGFVVPVLVKHPSPNVELQRQPIFHLECCFLPYRALLLWQSMALKYSITVKELSTQQRSKVTKLETFYMENWSISALFSITAQTFGPAPVNIMVHIALFLLIQWILFHSWYASLTKCQNEVGVSKAKYKWNHFNFIITISSAQSSCRLWECS